MAEMSRFAGWGRWPARMLLIVLGLLVTIPLIQTAAPVPMASGNAKADRADVLLYDHIIDRVRAGRNYYQVAAQAQRDSGYPLRPFVTMRPPTLAVLQANLPNRTVVAMLFWALMATMIIVWGGRLRQSDLPMPRVILGLLLVISGGATLTLPELLVWHEAWAALLIALSLALRSERRFAASVGVGLAAVLIREIAIVYPLVMLGMAVIERRWREASAWCAAILVFGAFIAWHAGQVAAVVRPDDVTSPSWAAAGGWRFVVTMLWLTGPWRILPYWVASFCIPLSLLGWSGWRTSTALRGALIIGGYMIAFALFGRANNFYWGFLIAPLVPLGLLFAPRALTDLAKAAR
jgi:hypothetical protein